MDKRQLKKAIKEGKYRTFTGATIPLGNRAKLLFEDLISTVNNLDVDRHRITIPNIGELHKTIELVNDSLLISWVLVSDGQGQLFVNPGSSFDEAILQEIEDKIKAATTQTLTAIDVGNQIAADSSKSNISATDVMQRLHTTTNPKIASNVASRARGPQVSFIFDQGDRHLGGYSTAQSEFSNSETYKITNCRFVNFIGDKEVIVAAECPAELPLLADFFRKFTLRIRIDAGSLESKVLKCAAFCDAEFDIGISIGFDIKRNKEVLHLAQIFEHESIFSEARSYLELLSQGQF